MGQSSIIIHKGRREEKYEIYVEDYVMSYLKEETETLERAELYFYGLKEKGGKRYIIYGAGRDRCLAVFDNYSLLEEIGCRLTQAGPIFLVREEEGIYETNGYELFYQDNKEMQSYLIRRKQESADQDGRAQQQKAGRSPWMDPQEKMRGARRTGAREETYETWRTDWQGGTREVRRTAWQQGMRSSMRTDRKMEQPGMSASPYRAVSLQLGIVLVALVAIVINSTNSYDKMNRLNQSAAEVFFAIENQEAEAAAGTDAVKNEITVERNGLQDQSQTGETAEESPQDSRNAGADNSEISGAAEQEEDILKLVALENEGHAEQQEGIGQTEQQEDIGQMEQQEDMSGRREDIEQAEQQKDIGQKDMDQTGLQEGMERADDENRADMDQTEQGVEALSRNVTRYYRVERGDTLYTICQKIYGDTAYVQKICELNQIANPDKICYGQKIILP